MKFLPRLWRGQKVSFYHSSTSYQLVQNDEGPQISFAELCKECTPPFCSLTPSLFGGHLQTAWTQMTEDREVPVYYKRKVFDSNHPSFKGQFSVDFMVPPSVDDQNSSQTREDEVLPARTKLFEIEEDTEFLSTNAYSPILISLHGMSGGSNETYIRHVLAAIGARDGEWAACVVNSRGCAESKLTTGFLYNGRSTWDFRQVVNWLKEKHPNRPLFGVGFSIGANILANYLGEEGKNCPLTAAVLVSNPWNLEIASHALQRSWIGSEIYAKTLGRNMRNIVERHKDMIAETVPLDQDSIQKIKYVQDFDREIQCPTWGYPTEDAYYRDASSANVVLAIQTPFLAIQAEDDPISTKDAIPFAEIRETPFGVLCATSGGGHLGWFETRDERWFVKPITNFLDRMANSIDVEKSIELNSNLYPEFEANARKLARAKP